MPAGAGGRHNDRSVVSLRSPKATYTRNLRRSFRRIGGEPASNTRVVLTRDLYAAFSAAEAISWAPAVSKINLVPANGSQPYIQQFSLCNFIHASPYSSGCCLRCQNTIHSPATALMTIIVFVKRNTTSCMSQLYRRNPADAAICPIKSHFDTPLLEPCPHWR
jgi:hypothetical protein